MQKSFSIAFKISMGLVFLLAVRPTHGSPADSDTLHLSLKEAESLFTAHSTALLAKKFEVEADKASAMQARLWENPTVNVEQGLYNWKTGKYFDMTRTGQTAIEVDQLIDFAGKRSKHFAAEQIKGRMSEYEFFDLLRVLKHQLRSDFFALHFLRKSLSVYDNEIRSVRALVQSFQDQYQKGNVALTELGRLQALLFGLEDDRNETIENIREHQAALNLMLLLPSSALLEPVAADSTWENFSTAGWNCAGLVDTAHAGRYDLKIARAQADLDQAELAVEKAQRIPDLSIGAAWDRSGSYIENYNSANFSLQLPLWNRNQGNILAAKNQVRSSELMAEQADRGLASEVYLAFTSLMESDSLYQNWKEPFAEDFDKLAEGIYKSYQKKNISLIEFVDFYQSYTESKTRMIKLQNRRIDAFENINYVTGKELFHFE